MALPLASFSRRMEWLERFRPGNSSAKLHVNVIKEKDAFLKDLGGIPCQVWNPKGDEFTPTRILARIINEDPSSRTKMPIRDLYRIRLIPLQHMPRTSLDGAPLEYLLQAFAQPFTSLRSAPNSPRDLMLRGTIPRSHFRVGVDQAGR